MFNQPIPMPTTVASTTTRWIVRMPESTDASRSYIPAPVAQWVPRVLPDAYCPGGVQGVGNRRQVSDSQTSAPAR